MCYKKYSISCVGLNILIFGTCILTVSVGAFIDIKNKELDNSNQQVIYYMALIGISSLLILGSICSITKMDYYLSPNDYDTL
jgi:uncharacterized membrane protein